MTDYPTVPWGAIDAITGGYHGDPFAILGPHEHEAGVVVRVFHPGASAVVVEAGGEAYAMERVHDSGLFEVIIAGAALPFRYTLSFSGVDGNSWQADDPYRYPPALSEFDEYLLAEGTDAYIYRKLGAQLMELAAPGDEPVAGVRFAVWAPSAERVSVVGNFNQWDGRRQPMRFHVNSGIWELFLPGLGAGELYKYEIKTRYMDYMVAKSDPVGFFSELRPNTASIVWDLNQYEWQDEAWMARRRDRDSSSEPMSVYEVHLGSWRLKDGWEWLTYRELAEQLVPYAKELGYTHV